MATIKGVRVESHIKELMDILDDKKKEALLKLGLAGEDNAKIEITNLVYDTPESPNYKRTGNLRNSLTHTDNGKDTVYIGTNVEYAPYVEYGTSKMPPRPYLKNAIMNHLDEYKNIIENIFKS